MLAEIRLTTLFQPPSWPNLTSHRWPKWFTQSVDHVRKRIANVINVVTCRLFADSSVVAAAAAAIDAEIDSFTSKDDPSWTTVTSDDDDVRGTALDRPGPSVKVHSPRTSWTTAKDFMVAICFVCETVSHDTGDTCQRVMETVRRPRSLFTHRIVSSDIFILDYLYCTLRYFIIIFNFAGDCFVLKGNLTRGFIPGRVVLHPWQIYTTWLDLINPHMLKVNLLTFVLKRRRVKLPPPPWCITTLRTLRPPHRPSSDAWTNLS